MSNIYITGEYMEKNPAWHVVDSPWKAKQIIKALYSNNIKPISIAEIGCGAGEILNQLYHQLPEDIEFHGYEISPQAFELSQTRKNDRVHFYLKDLLGDENAFFDLVLAIDVFEHVPDYYGFLRKLRGKGTYKIFHIPLDLSVLRVLLSTPIMKSRESTGHIHYFNKETALATLKDTGYEIIDYFYTCWSIELPSTSFKSLLNLTRKLLFALNKDMTVRTLGGFSLMVLAK